MKQRIIHPRQGSKLQARVSAFSVALSAVFSLGFAGPLLAAPAAQQVEKASDAPTSATVAADLKPDHMPVWATCAPSPSRCKRKGTGLRGSELGYGYPAYGYGYGYESGVGYGGMGATGGDGAVYAGRYSSARPGYEIRMLIGSASILAERGEGEACRAVLGAARNQCERYAAELPRRQGAEGEPGRVEAASTRSRQARRSERARLPIRSIDRNRRAHDQGDCLTKQRSKQKETY